LPKSISADDRAELLRALEASVRVETSAARKMDFDAAQTLYVIAATVATLDIVWKWYQAARAKSKNKNTRLDVVITMADGKQVNLEKVTFEELRQVLIRD
jgi:hypothetical protein